MLERSQNSYPVLRQFREFYGEVARLRNDIEKRSPGQAGFEDIATGVSGSPIQVSAALVGSDPASGPVAADASREDFTPSDQNWDEIVTRRVWSEMAIYLDQRMYEVKAASSSLSHDLQEELLYLMAAFADETFVCLLEWPGKDYWAEHLMELRLFHSQVAGQEIFRRIDTLLARQDFGIEELAAVYLMALALGFKGQFLRDPAAVDECRKKLFDRLLMTNPNLRRRSHRLFPEAYLHTVVEGAPVRLPEPKKWWLIVAGVVGAWLLLSSVAWFSLTKSTRSTLAVTMHSLGRIANQQKLTAGSSGKWIVTPFSPQNGGFRLELPANLPLDMGGSGTASLLIGVQGLNGYSAGPEAQIQAWLSLGSTSFPSRPISAGGKERTVASVALMDALPEGVTASLNTKYFLVDPALTAPDLALHPQLAFPPAGRFGLTVGSITLCSPDRSSQSRWGRNDSA
jgi:type VI secretion system protein ImpK